MSGVFSLFSLEGQTALVTGGTRGLGQAMALGLAEAGADILLAQRDTSNTETKEKIESVGRKCIIYTCDVSSHASVTALLPSILADGHTPIILINCAGIQRRHHAHEFPDEDWNLVLQVNLTSIFTLSRDFGKHLLSRPADDSGRRGAIINVASIMSFQGGYLIAAYASAKGGLANMTRAMSNEWARSGINVNAIAPGFVSTDLTEELSSDPAILPKITDRIPMGRWGKPEDFKGVTVWLASKASAFVNGETIVVDGGWMGW